MPTFRSTPFEIDAVQLAAPLDAFDPSTQFGGWLHGRGAKSGETFFVGPMGPPENPDPLYVTFNAPDGARTAVPGDWIAVDSAGTYRVYKPATFAATFKPAAGQEQRSDA